MTAILTVGQLLLVNPQLDAIVAKLAESFWHFLVAIYHWVEFAFAGTPKTDTTHLGKKQQFNDHVVQAVGEAFSISTHVVDALTVVTHEAHLAVDAGASEDVHTLVRWGIEALAGAFNHGPVTQLG